MILNRIEGKPEEGMHGSSVALQDSTRGSVKTIFLVIEKKGVEFDEVRRSAPTQRRLRPVSRGADRSNESTVRRSAPTQRRLRQDA